MELLSEFQLCLGYTFKNPHLLKVALTHTSYAYEQSNVHSISEEHNERMEFLGDAVLGLVIAEVLMEILPNAPEGRLSRLRSALVSRKALSEFASRLALGKYLLLGRGERSTGGAEKASILASSFEAVIGAIYLDGGLPNVKTFILACLGARLQELKEQGDAVFAWVDTKTWLQEQTQARFRALPLYRLVESWGEEHSKWFRVQIEIDGRVVGTGDGRTKKQAEQEAALQAIQFLDGQSGQGYKNDTL